MSSAGMIKNKIRTQHITTYLICVHKEQDEQNHLRQKNYQQDNEELPERGRALLQQQHRQYCKLNLLTKL